jgi:hypothetical protein
MPTLTEAEERTLRATLDALQNAAGYQVHPFERGRLRARALDADDAGRELIDAVLAAAEAKANPAPGWREFTPEQQEQQAWARGVARATTTEGAA